MGGNTLDTAIGSFLQAGGPQNIAQVLQQRRQQQQQQQQQQQAFTAARGLFPQQAPVQPGAIAPTGASPTGIGGGIGLSLGGGAVPTFGGNVAAAVNQPSLQQTRALATQQQADALFKVVSLAQLGPAGQNLSKALLNNPQLFANTPAARAIAESTNLIKAAQNRLVTDGEDASIRQLQNAARTASPQVKGILQGALRGNDFESSLNNASAALGTPEFAGLAERFGFDIQQTEFGTDEAIRQREAQTVERKKEIEAQKAADINLELKRRETKKVPQKFIDFKVPSGFQLADPDDLSKGVVPIPGGPETRLTPEQAAKTQLLRDGRGAIQKVRQQIIGPDGVDRELLFQTNVKLPFSEGRLINAEILNAIEAKLRAESGAAVPETEVKRAAVRFFPSVLDNDVTIATKLDNLERFLTGAEKLIDPTRSLIQTTEEAFQQDGEEEFLPEGALPPGITEQDIRDTIAGNPGETRASILRKLSDNNG